MKRFSLISSGSQLISLKNLRLIQVGTVLARGLGLTLDLGIQVVAE